MFEWLNRGAIFLAPLLLVLVLLLIQRRREERMHAAYEQIAAGMNLARIESLLGRPGSRISLEEVPQSRIGPVVRGDEYYKWEDEGGRQIVIALVDYHVRNKWYWEPDL